MTLSRLLVLHIAISIPGTSVPSIIQYFNAWYSRTSLIQSSKLQTPSLPGHRLVNGLRKILQL